MKWTVAMLVAQLWRVNMLSHYVSKNKLSTQVQLVGKSLEPFRSFSSGSVFDLFCLVAMVIADCWVT